MILGMDKEPTNFTVSLNDVTTSISNVVYTESTKVGYCSLLRCPSTALAWASDSQLILALLTLGGHRDNWLAGEPWGECRRRNLCMLDMDPGVLLALGFWVVGVDTLEEGSSSLGYLKVVVLMSDVIEKIWFNALASFWRILTSVFSHSH